MAYSEKYYHEYCNRFGTLCRVSMLERDYVGEAEDKDCSEVPFSLTYDSTTDDKFDRLKTSTAEVRFIGGPEFNMEELYTADSMQYKIEHYVNGVLKWTGWVVPNGFTEDWSGGLHEMVVQAIDGLSLLDQYRFLSPSGSIWNQYMRHTTMLRQCLDFIGLDLPLHTMVNLDYEGQTQEDDPVYISWTHSNTYMDTSVEDEDTLNHTYLEYSNNVFSCYEVIMDICRRWNAKLYQNNGAWKFKRVNEDYGTMTGKFWRVYENNSGQSGTIPYDPIVNIACDWQDDNVLLDGAVKYMDNVYRWQNIQYLYRYKQNGDALTPLIPNGYFYPHGVPTDPSTYVPDGWTRNGFTGNVSKEPALGGDHPPDNYDGVTLKISGTASIVSDSGLKSADLTNQVYLKKGDKIYLSWWQKMPPLSPIGNAESLLKITLRSFKDDSNTQFTDYNLVNTGYDKGNNYLDSRWQEYVPNNIRPYSFVGVNSTQDTFIGGWARVIVNVPDVPANGYLSIALRTAAVRQEGMSGVDYTGVSFYAFNKFVDIGTGSVNWQESLMYAISNEWKISSVYTGRVVNESDKNTSKGRVATFEQNKIFNRRSEPVNILTSDVQNADTIGSMIFDNDSGWTSPITGWNDRENPYLTFAPIDMICACDIMRQYRNIWRVVEGDIIANGIDIDSCIVFEDRPTERYIIQRGVFEEKNCILDGATLLQISDSNDTAMTGDETIQENYGSIDLDRRFIN